jgi:hypothetical protein
MGDDIASIAIQKSCSTCFISDGFFLNVLFRDFHSLEIDSPARSSIRNGIHFRGLLCSGSSDSGANTGARFPWSEGTVSDADLIAYAESDLGRWTKFADANHVIVMAPAFGGRNFVVLQEHGWS